MTNFQKTIKCGAIALAIFIIVSIFSSIVWGLNILSGINKNNHTGNMDEIKLDNITNLNNINSLEVELKSYSAEVVKGTEFKIECEEEDNIKIRIENNTLKIKDKSGLFNFGDEGKILKVYVPNKELKYVSIEAGAGTIFIENVTTSKLEVNTGAGVTTIKSVTSDKTEIDAGVGKVEVVNSTLNNLELDSGVGEVKIEAYVYGRSQIDAGIGNIDINLLGDETIYKINTKGNGNIKINGKEYSNNETIGQGTNYVDINGGIGNIKVTLN